MDKMIIFIVEGESDQIALSVPISKLIDQIDSRFRVVFLRNKNRERNHGGDITSDFFLDKNGIKQWIKPDHLARAIYDKILFQTINFRNVFPEDISEIIQIVDTDGTFIPDEKVILNIKLPASKSPRYYDDRIETISPKGIVQRNKRKKDNMNLLSNSKYLQFAISKNNTLSSVAFSDLNDKQYAGEKEDRIVSVPYSVFFFSSNLDHYIHSDANYPKNKKIEDARTFLLKYRETNKFVKCFSDKNIRDLDYVNSWRYIRKDVNSLQKHTNLGVLLNDLISQLNQ